MKFLNNYEEAEGEDEQEILLELKQLEIELSSRLDASIRHHMRKSGINKHKSEYLLWIGY
jgi:hypothetical protein